MLNNNAGNADSIFFKHYRLEPALTAAETLAPFDGARAAVERTGVGWRTGAGTTWYAFGLEAEARLARRVLQHYPIDAIGRVGAPTPAFTYMLSSGRAPSGPVEGETCAAFDPGWILMRRELSRWTIVQGVPSGAESGCRELFSFGDAQEREARAAFGIIKKYGFTQACRVGGPRSAFTYLRR